MKVIAKKSPKTDGRHVVPPTLWSKELHDVLKEAGIKSPSSNFVLLKASLLSLEDAFMKHEPRTTKERKFKKQLAAVICASDIKDFWCPKHNPSFCEDETKICFEMGSAPAVTPKTFSEWDKMAKSFMPECKSRLGTKDEYIAFMGVIIKSLTEMGWDIDVAWNAVCNDSYNLGNYKNNGANDFHIISHEPTGSREVCGFCDLADSVKYLAEDEATGCYYMASGCCYDDSDKCPIADIQPDNATNYSYAHAVGWVVLEKSVIANIF